MFDSFLKKTGRHGDDADGASKKSARREDDAASVSNAKQEAMAAADRLTGEDAAAEFILQCSFSDARLKAAQQIQSQPTLQKVLQAMRNTDRRVAKLMQQRLDAIAHRAAERQRAEDCVRQAQRLVGEQQLTPNQVADLDRAWQQVSERPEDLSAAFDAARAALRERLENQAALQRTALEIRKRQQQRAQSLAGAPTAASPEELARTLDELERDMQACAQAQEAQSLPRQLLSEFGQEQERLRQAVSSLEQRLAALREREAALLAWEAEAGDAHKPEELKRAWAALPPPDETDRAALEARFGALLRRAGGNGGAGGAVVGAEAQTPGRKAEARPRASEEERQRFFAALGALEKALQEGALHDAVEHDRQMHAMESDALRLSHAQAAQLARARAELKRLQGWARWSGNISRDELQKAAEELPTQSLAIPELAKRVGSLRERWKALDTSAGAAGKEVWLRFDAACTAAYAPVAEHAKKLAQERREHLAAAEALIAQAERFAAEFLPEAQPEGEVDPAVEWRSVASEASRLEQQWKRLGPIDRKAKKTAEARFTAAMRRVTEPLTARRKTEAAERERLIEEAKTLDAADRHAVDRLRRLQERWQQHARALPLEHHAEQALWKRFRSACDALFAARKEVAKGADAQRQQHLHEKEAVCAALEAATSETPDAVRRALRSARDEWTRIGPVPRAAEARIENRYRAAVATLQKRLDDAQRAAGAARADAVRAKLALCRRVEGLLASGQQPDEELAQREAAGWEGVPAAAPEFEQALRRRFDAALAAWKAGDKAYLAQLEHNRGSAMQQLLRLEILAGIESPPQFSRDRLKLQVEVLQSSLKSGQKAAQPVPEQLAALCGMPALLDDAAASRLDRIVSRVGA